MTRRWPLLAGAVALSLSVPQAAFATPQPTVAASSPDAAATDALRELKADAEGAVRVQRDAAGDVAFVSSANGRAMLDSDAASPRRSAQDQLAHYGDAFGIDGTTSRAVVTQALDSQTGGSVVRADQVVDGVPVFGGQVVMSLDKNQGVVSVTSATTDATKVAAASVSQLQAQRTAVAVTAKSHRARPAGLTATVVGRRLYDPALVHLADPVGVRPVWQFEVTNGSDIRETVLVGTGRGEVALHFNDAPEISRRICDNMGLQTTASDVPVPICPTPARSEGGAASAVADVNQAYTNLGATSDAYAALDGIDLTQFIGATVAGTKRLQSTVRWCFSDDDCPYGNAFWDGTQMVFGTGYAAADDVVGHELTHGYVQHTAALFSLHQSGALNESLADTIGEIVDHRNPLSAASDTNWTVGEDLPGSGALRSLKDPTLFGQPDKMTDYVAADAAPLPGHDNGGVHENDGIGNKTAYLISQGGTFNGHAITGIDGSDNGLAKTGRLYLETIKRLTSGAQYADLGRALVATCDEFANAVPAVGGFTTSNCDSVVEAITATELALQPADPAAASEEAPSTCAASAHQLELRRDDDAFNGFGFIANGLWQRTPANGTPAYSRSGPSSWFAWDPDPSLDGIASSQIISSSFVVPASQPSYVRFNHAYVFEWYDPVGGFPAYYPDGGQVLVQTLSGSTWTTRAVTWDNGPDKSLGETTTKVFGGDSHGYGSSRVNLTSLAGQTARVVFKVTGDQDTYFTGWWVDDVRLTTCPNAVASVPATTVAAATTSAKVSWTAPSYVGGSPVASYRITRSDGKVNTEPASARSIPLTGLKANTNVTVAVAAVTQDGHVGASSSVPVYATTAAVTSSRPRAVRNKSFTVTAKVVRRGTTTVVVAGVPLTLQRLLTGRKTWRKVSVGSTSAKGTRSWSVHQSVRTYYRVVTLGTKNWLGTTSAARTVAMR